MVVDVSPIAYFAPILAYLLVAIVISAVLVKTKIISESSWVNVFVALFVATLFVSAGGVRTFVEVLTPWFALLMISLFMLLLLVGFVGDPLKGMIKGVGIVFVLLFAVVFLISGFVVYSDLLVKYLPGPSYGVGADPDVLYAFDWLYSSRVMGGILLLLASGLVSWIVVRSGIKK